MPQFRKKPVVIKAVQYTGAPGSEDDIQRFASETGIALGSQSDAGVVCLVIPTLEGDHLARPGDWIIRGVQGEFYPCKPDIFAATYEEVA